MLTTLILIPLIGALLISLVKSGTAARQFALGTATVAFIWTLWLLSQFDLNGSGLQFSEYIPWADAIGLSYSLGVDGLSLPLLVLNAFLTAVVVYSSTAEIGRSQLYYALILLVNAGVAGAFLAQNLLLFVLCFELELIPLYLLIAIWGGEKRGYAAMKFLLYTALSGILILAAFLGVVVLSGRLNFDYDSLASQNLSLQAQLIILTLLLVGLGIKIPLVPLHTWSPDAYVEASPPIAILLGGILAKLGTYGLIRFGLQMFPQTWSIVAPGLAVIGAISVMYGSLNAIAQQDIKRMVAYSSIGHMGYILVSAAAGTELSILGAIAQMIAHGLILALLFNLVGIVETKVGTRELSKLNGLMNPIRGLPLVSGLLVTAGMASAGIPGLVGFAAEFIVFQGSFPVFPLPTLVCILSSGLTAVYFVILLNRTCFGKLDNNLAYYDRLTWAERWPALVLCATIFYFGLQPNALIRWMQPTAVAIASTLPPTPELIAQQPQ
ncbi:NADH-quinone oxidoreductase subunit M [Spirulina subsalsa FACHB-351]|uniref:NADH-quinone oxidoreductase subunit M n=1 Tax=Spirulina subsalsa FACHB-351 TaxID=234711 RepID=A0ABT3L111_9CYAN|nr:NADH-quinone oxidoreductase subunit M [Spirulina subsalsa]MCW6035193.1 NADH-quinone oxidoreductase subunit M [Spirulina subsalsa FACHB-351]